VPLQVCLKTRRFWKGVLLQDGCSERCAFTGEL
jgi:hypothetical protein